MATCGESPCSPKKEGADQVMQTLAGNCDLIRQEDLESILWAMAIREAET